MASQVGPMTTPILPTTDPTNLEISETHVVALEWKISNLKTIFDSTRGEIKSKCIKSPVFGDPDTLWEIIFYPNSGPSTTPTPTPLNPTPTPSHLPGECSSFYLSAVATDEEKAGAVRGKWGRRGVYGFRFEVKTPAVKGQPVSTLACKEASNHSFGSKLRQTRPTLLRRPPLRPHLRHIHHPLHCGLPPPPPAGAFLNLPAPSISWTSNNMHFSYSPEYFAATGPGWTGSSGSWKGVAAGRGGMLGGEGRGLGEAVKGLFDREVYSDVEFVLPGRRKVWDDSAREAGEEEEEESSEGEMDVEDEMGFRSSAASGGARAPKPRSRKHSGVDDPSKSVSTSISGGTSTEAGQLHSSFPTQTHTHPLPFPSLHSHSHSHSTESDHPPRPGTSASRRSKKQKQPRTVKAKLWANKMMLKRSDYFEAMFSGSFSETGDGGLGMDADDEVIELDEDLPEDSDIEEELLSDDEAAVSASSAAQPAGTDDPMDGPLPSTSALAVSTTNRPATPIPFLPYTRAIQRSTSRNTDPNPKGPNKTRIVIRDAAYRTWYALIYYLYTDTIVFAPLSSAFIQQDEPGGRPASAIDETGAASGSVVGMPPSSMLGRLRSSGSFSAGSQYGFAGFPISGSSSSRLGGNNNNGAENQILSGIKGRREWIRTWLKEKEATLGDSGGGKWEGPLPCSAKGIYRLADKLDLPVLKQKAFQHIIGSMTVQNCPYEVFTNFSATYEQVRVVQISFFLHHWNIIKDSKSMTNLWTHIRLGRFEAFTEIWPLIITNLTYGGGATGGSGGVGGAVVQGGGVPGGFGDGMGE